MATLDTAWALLGDTYDVGPDDVAILRKLVYTFESRVAQQWRVGRVLLAGDAAHTMPPYLGQGACSGMRDALNLAWKLDLVLRERASERLLDTYELERRPHATALVHGSIALGRIANTRDPQEAAARDAAFLAGKVPPPADAPADRRRAAHRCGRRPSCHRSAASRRRGRSAAPAAPAGSTTSSVSASPGHACRSRRAPDRRPATVPGRRRVFRSCTSAPRSRTSTASSRASSTGSVPTPTSPGRTSSCSAPLAGRSWARSSTDWPLAVLAAADRGSEPVTAATAVVQLPPEVAACSAPCPSLASSTVAWIRGRPPAAGRHRRRRAWRGHRRRDRQGSTPSLGRRRAQWPRGHRSAGCSLSSGRVPVRPDAAQHRRRRQASAVPPIRRRALPGRDSLHAGDRADGAPARQRPTDGVAVPPRRRLRRRDGRWSGVASAAGAGPTCPSPTLSCSAAWPACWPRAPGRASPDWSTASSSMSTSPPDSAASSTPSTTIHASVTGSVSRATASADSSPHTSPLPTVASAPASSTAHRRG